MAALCRMQTGVRRDGSKPWEDEITTCDWQSSRLGPTTSVFPFVQYRVRLWPYGSACFCSSLMQPFDYCLSTGALWDAPSDLQLLVSTTMTQ